MKILIVETVWMGKASYKLFDKTLLTAFSILPMLYARQIAAITPKNHTVIVINERYTPIDFNEQYDLVNINFTTATSPRAYHIADTFRSKGIPVVLSGLHASALPEEAKQHADSVLLGHGELNWLTLLEDFENKKLQPLYPSPPYTPSIHIPPTEIHLPGFVVTGAIEATRGCPYQCDFCPETMVSQGSFFTRPVDDVIKEIKALPQKTIMFYDNSLTVNPEYAKMLFKKMKGLHKRFFCNGNTNVLARDPDFVRLSKEAGCVAWLIGFESVSQESLNSIGKTTNIVDDYQQAVQNIHENGMIVIGCFILGFDTDTPEIFHQTLTTIQQLQLDIADFSILTPFPGTSIYQTYEKEGRLLTKDWTHYTFKEVVYTPKQMTPEELQQGVQWLYQNFYNPSYTLKRIIKSLRGGLCPFVVVLARNAVAMMNSRRLFPSK